jgi:hypothetical protein
LVSVAKSSVFFSPKTLVEVRAEICTILNILTEANSNKYLGLPSIVGADRSDYFKYLVERILKLINGWKNKTLFMAGKEVLLKAVAQAMSVFAMPVFKIPKSICKGITDAISQFWWGDDANAKKIHWFTWWNCVFQKKKRWTWFA